MWPFSKTEKPSKEGKSGDSSASSLKQEEKSTVSTTSTRSYMINLPPVVDGRKSEYEFVEEIDQDKHAGVGFKTGQITNIYVKPDGNYDEHFSAMHVTSPCFFAELLPGQYYNEKDRPHWEEKYNCLLSMVGFSVGLSNLYRFPYMCYIHGGLAFLIPYTFFIVVLAIPVLYLEILVGQFTNSGMINVWKKLVPILRGIGWCQSILPMMNVFFNNAILTWGLHYAFLSLAPFATGALPWIGCHNDWNTVHCRDIYPDFEKVNVPVTDMRAGAEYFRGRVQRRWKSVYADPKEVHNRKDNGKNQTFGFGEDNLGTMGLPEYDMVIYLFVIYATIYFLLHKGLRFTGKGLVCFMVGSPYLIMILLVYRSAPVTGAKEGIALMWGFTEDRLWHWKTWVDAAEQVFFSVGIGCGVHITLASYNKFQPSHLFRDAVCTVLIDFGTSLICGTMAFIAVGCLAETDNSKVEDLFVLGPDLLFEVMVDFWVRFPGADFFIFMVFLMVVLVGLESCVTAMICTKEALFEAFGEWFDQNGRTRWVLINGMLLLSFTVGVLCITRSGMHLFMLLDNYTAGAPYLICSLLMTVGFTWFWGLRELCDAAESMTGRRPNMFVQISWKYFCPLVLTLVLIPELFLHEEASYMDRGKKIVFTKSIQIFGRIYTHFPTMFIPLGVIVHMCTSRGNTCKTKLLLGLSPNYAHDQILESGSGERAKSIHYLYFFDRPKLFKRMSGVSKIHPEVKIEGDSDFNLPEELQKASTDSLEAKIMGVSFQLPSTANAKPSPSPAPTNENKPNKNRKKKNV